MTFAAVKAPTGPSADKAAQPKPAEGTPVQPQLRRLTPLPLQVDVPEPLLGATSEIEIPRPFNLDKTRGPAALSVQVIDNEEYEATTAAVPLWPSGRMTASELAAHTDAAIHVRFKPTRTGIQYARLMVTATWPDGHEESQRIQLRSSARTIEHAPYRPAPVDPVADAHFAQQRRDEEARLAEDQTHTTPYAQNAVNDLDHASGLAQAEARAVAREQQQGVSEVAQEAERYKAPDLPRSVWWDLLELALTLGTAGTAAGVSRLLVGSLAKYVNAGLDPQESRLVSTFAEFVKNGMKQGVRAALDGGLPRDRAGSTMSTDQMIAFFSAQSDALHALIAHNERLVIDRERLLRPLLRTNPQLATGLMTELQQAFQAATQTAKGAQAMATATQFVTYRARARLGVEPVREASTPREERAVTKLDRARPTHVEHDPGALSGLLDIYVEADSRRPRVVGARLNGVAQAVADRLAAADLREAAVPVRFILGWNTPAPTIVTRDESGRVRASGNLQRLARFSPRADTSIRDEESAVVPAEHMIVELMTGTLAARHIRIVTDDRSQGK